MKSPVKLAKAHPWHALAYSVLVVLVSAFATLWLVESEPTSPVWGDVSTAAGAVATLAAVVFSIRRAQKADAQAHESAKRAERADERAENAAQREIDRASEAARRYKRAQAARITWWVQIGHQPDSIDFPINESEPQYRSEAAQTGYHDLQPVSIHVINASENLIYAAVLRYGDDPPFLGHDHWLGPQPPGERVYADRVPIFAAGSARISTTLSVIESRSYEYLEFQDADGQMWRRRFDGALTDIDAAPRRAHEFSAH